MKTKICPTCQTAVSDELPGRMCPACLMAAARPKPNVKQSDQATSMLSLGKVVNLFPEFEILREIGRGGMGVVFEAHQKNLGRSVALKVVQNETGDVEFSERFVREARAMAKLHHPNIVNIHDAGERDNPDDDRKIQYLTMEFVDGLNLRQISQRAKLTPAEAIALVPQLCNAIQYAHDQGVIHRDIKPENILLDSSGQVKVADFGLAKVDDLNNATLTRTRQVMGTYNYMAPEQMESLTAVDHRADIYSLGVVIYELLTGELPMGRFQAPSQKANVDSRLDEVVMRALEKEPQRRHQNVSEIKTGFESVSNGTTQALNAHQLAANMGPGQMNAPNPSTFQKAAPIAPQPPVKPTAGPYVQTEYVDDSRKRRWIMVVYQSIAMLFCMSCAVAFILGSDEFQIVREEASVYTGICLALFGGYLFACSYFVRVLLNLPSPKLNPEELAEFSMCKKPIAMIRMVAMAFAFLTALMFITSSDVGEFFPRGQNKYYKDRFVIAGICSAILCGFLFAFSGFAGEMFDEESHH